MSTGKEVVIYGKELKLDVVMPEDKVWKFALAFGNAFMIHDFQGGEYPQAIDGYYYHSNAYHVKVSIPVYEEQNFYNFLEKFCKENNLPLRWKE